MVEKKAKEAKKEKPVQEKAVQAELNIGMVGHVDHGKCIAADEIVLLNSELVEAGELAVLGEKTTKATEVSRTEQTYNIPGLRAFALSNDFSPVSAQASVFAQEYNGVVFRITTKRGKNIRVSPKHPLLVHNGLELEWKEAQAIRKNDCIVALRTIPTQEFAKDYGNDWQEKISSDFWMVKPEQFQSLLEKTKGFAQWNSLSAEEINQLRILQKISIYRLEKKLGLNRGELAAALRTRKLTPKQEGLLKKYFSTQAWQKPTGTILNMRSKSKCFCEIFEEKEPFNDGMLRLLAFILAEGHVRKNKLQIAQSQNELLEEAQETMKREFGICFKQMRREDYELGNTAIVRYLGARYGIKTGRARETGIPMWVFTLPKEKLASFLNMFFSAEANADKKSGQIALIQANKKSIEIISYCLKKFGTSHSVHEIMKAATNGTNKKRQYWQLTISGINNLELFLKHIGFSLPYKQKALEEMVKKTNAGKQSDEMILFKKQLFAEIVGLLGWKKRILSPAVGTLRKQPWFWAYNDCHAKNAISPKNLEVFTSACRERIQALQGLEKKIMQNEFSTVIGEIGSSWQWLAKKTGTTPKVIFRQRKNATAKELETIRNALSEELKTRIENTSKAILRIEKNYSPMLEFDRVKKIEKENYEGKIIDLQVPGYHNFAAGCGALICHNTSLTQALTGKWTDTHSEELKRGISIRLGYADITFYKCPKCKGGFYTNKEICPNCGKKAEKLRTVSFVDAPGHETLMTTMLSGAALMHGAVLVIAANEKCPQPQTAEHLVALKITGIKNIVIAQNKIDLVDREQAISSMKEIREFLAMHGYKDAPIIPVAAHFGTNIDLLIEAIEKYIPTPHFELDKPLLMYCARSFDVNKPGETPKNLRGGVVGGSILRGTVKINDRIALSPGIDGKEIETTVASLNCASGHLKEARPGGLMAIGTMLDPSITQNDKMRGQVVGKPGSLPAAVSKLRLKVEFIERLLIEGSAEIKTNEKIVLTVGTMPAIGTVTGYANGIMDVNLGNAVVVEKGQKVALSKRETTRWRLVAFGIVQ